MNQIINNIYVKIFNFTYLQELLTFVGNQFVEKKLFIENSSGDNYYCCIGYHSLTKEKKFLLSFSSYELEDRLDFLYWDKSFILSTNDNIYLIDEDLKIKTSFEINTSLVGLYLLNKDRVLILDEYSYKIINSKGDILDTKIFDLIENFSITDNILSIQTNNDETVIELNSF
jgi:hypothetical protein